MHCEAGISRTAIFLAAYLIARGATLEQALETVKRTRPLPLSDPAAIAVLREFAGTLAPGHGRLAPP
jgi:protein-tyrosine phosphatase